MIVQSMPTEPTPGDFRASVSTNQVGLPAALVAPLRAQGATTLSGVISYLESFPSAVASMLDWSVADVERAHLKLVRELAASGLAVPAAAAKARPAFGARDPAELSVRR
jgi:hypothetical protein